MCLYVCHNHQAASTNFISNLCVYIFEPFSIPKDLCTNCNLVWSLVMVNLVPESLSAYIPLFLVFLSGLGFSIQGLVIKHLAEAYDFHGSYELILVRGMIQITVSCCFIYNNKRNGEVAKLFGDSPLASKMLLCRAVLGFFGMSFAFLSIEHMPLADASVILMQSPIVAAILGYVVLGEPWRLAEFTATFISMIGTVLITRPPFIFNALGVHVASDGENYSSTSDAMGPLYGVIAAFAAGGSFVAVRVLGTTAKMPWANVSLAASLGQFLLSIPFVLLSGQGLLVSGGTAPWLLLAAGGTIGTFSQIAMTYGMQREKSASAAGMRSSDILFAFIWEALFTNDRVTALSVAGAVLVLAGVMIIVIFKSSTLAAEKPPDVLPITAADAECSHASSADGAAGKDAAGGWVYNKMLEKLGGIQAYQRVSGDETSQTSHSGVGLEMSTLAKDGRFVICEDDDDEEEEAAAGSDIGEDNLEDCLDFSLPQSPATVVATAEERSVIA
jgi:drug/metabolite transporter (DMT)-like permease